MENLNNPKVLSDECLRDLERIKEVEGDPELTDWEDEFLKSIKIRLYEDRPLTDRQEDTLCNIEEVVMYGR